MGAKATEEYLNAEEADDIAGKKGYLEKMCTHVNDRIFKETLRLDAEMMGSTLAGLYFTGNQVWTVNVGDSRCFLASVPMYQKTGKIQIFGYVSGSEENPKAGKQISDDHLEKTISGSGSCRDSDRNTDLDSRIAENGRIFCGDLRSNRFVLRSQTVSGRLKRSGKVLYGSGKETPEVK